MGTTPVDEPASRFGHGDERAKYNLCCLHGLPPSSLDETGPTGRIGWAAYPPQSPLGPGCPKASPQWLVRRPLPRMLEP